MRRRDSLQAAGASSAFAFPPAFAANGLVQLSDKPGLGIELDPAEVEKQEVLSSL